MDSGSKYSPTGDGQVSPRVMVVEDEVLIRLAIADDLRREGFEVLEAQSGDAALALLVGGVDVDLVFTDVRMPGALDGIGLARTVVVEFPHVSIVLTSANAIDLEDECLQHIPFLPKPYQPARVGRLIRAELEKQGGSDARSERGRRNGSARRRGDPRPA